MTNYKCPNCAASLSVGKTDNIVKCEYCGTVINLDRTEGEMSSHRAAALAQEVREYKKHKAKVDAARLALAQKENRYSQIQKDGEKLSFNTYLTAAAIWLGVYIVIASILSSALHYQDVIRIFLDIVLFVGCGYYALKFAKSQKDKKTEINAEKEEQARIQKNYAQKALDEVSVGFDEDFLPEEARNDDAINFIIKALETERAYTLKQAIGQWEDQTAMEEKLREANARNVSANINNEKTNVGAETLGAFTGAALGALGGAVAREVTREAVKEIKRHL